MNRREKDNAKSAKSRGWFLEKADWMTSDEIEEEIIEETKQEQAQSEEELVISTVPVGEGKNKICPICREDFTQFFKQVDIDTHHCIYYM